MNAFDSDAGVLRMTGDATDVAPADPGRPRVLFLIRSLARGGAERQLVGLAAAMRRAGRDVSVACFYSGGAFQRDLVAAGVPVIDLRKRGRWDNAGFLWRLWRAFRKNDPDIVHGYLTVGNLLSLLAKLANRHTRVVWGVRSSYIDRDRYDWMSRLTFRLSRNLSRFADGIIVNSWAGAAHHASLGYPQARTTVVTNGIDTQRFRFDADGRARVRVEWGVPDDARLVGLVGRLDPMKDHPTYLKAAAILAKRDPHWRFVCVGAGAESDYARTLATLADSLGLRDRLIWAGARDDMPAVYSALDIAASTSYGEGFPNTVAEAMACGRPCVVTDVGDSARIVDDTGIVVPPQNPEALGEGLERLHRFMQAGTHPLATATRARIEQEFGVDSLVRNTNAVLQAVYGRPASANGGAP
ncbi:MAG: Glycosyl transferase, group 1 [Rhodanobacteraceae bacterium]|jgi:glycosyltransferase involved in cell wall biosynthesis|nr:MAG: Glycosyl transferase, group 1 [Rhodanobacteraceae bacterium]